MPPTHKAVPATEASDHIGPDDHIEQLIALNNRSNQVIGDMTTAVVQLKSVMEGYCETQKQMQTILQLVVTQVTTSISQRNDSVSLKVFFAVVLTLIAVIFLVVGLDTSDVWSWGKP